MLIKTKNIKKIFIRMYLLYRGYLLARPPPPPLSFDPLPAPLKAFA
jgi:hypothetical protein